MQNYQARFQERDLGYIARELGCSSTRKDVEEAIAALINSDKKERMTYLGAAVGNQSLGKLAVQGKKLLDQQPAPETEQWMIGHYLSVLGALDLPPHANEQQILSQLRRAGGLYAGVHKLTKDQLDLVAKNAFDALWDPARKAFAREMR